MNFIQVFNMNHKEVCAAVKNAGSSMVIIVER